MILRFYKALLLVLLRLAVLSALVVLIVTFVWLVGKILGG